MRKQTKLAAVLSTSALLAIGLSMTSFAATGWQQENGTWVYYDRNGGAVTDQWVKSGDNWFWLNDDGEMATDSLINDNDNYCYVDANGAMVTNQWVSIENEEYSVDNKDEPLNHWYYFGANGKAYRNSSSRGTASFKTINGKKYIFNDEAQMLYGWIDTDGQRVTGDDTSWRDGTYYCGDENDGAQAADKWEYLDIVDNDWEETEEAKLSSYNVFDSENQTRYFYFKPNGKKTVNESGKSINGKPYSFDQYGRMNAEWVNWDSTPTTATPDGLGTPSYTAGFRYYGSPEDGARVTKGWFQVVPGPYLNPGDYEDESEHWYYADKDGKLVASKIQTINGKKYAFNSYGVMQDGLKAIKLEDKSSTDIVDMQGGGDIDNLHFDNESDFKKNVSTLYKDGYKLYDFDSDGFMKTGRQTVSIDDTDYSFLFNKSGKYKGSGKFGVDNDKYYLGGMMLTASKDDKYVVIEITEDKKYGPITELKCWTTEGFLDHINAVASEPTKNDKYDVYYDVKESAKDTDTRQFRLINISGAVQKNKHKAKDGDDNCFNVGSNKQIQAVYIES